MNIIPKIQFDLRHVKIQSIIELLLYFLLILPDDVFAWGELYFSKTPSNIAYKWLNYKFGILALVLIIWGVWAIHITRNRVITTLVACFFFREIFFYMFSPNNCIDQKAYEIYIPLVAGFLLVTIVMRYIKREKDREIFFLRAIFLNIGMIFVSVLFHLNGIIDRYNAPNMDVEATGAICGMFFVFCLFTVKLKYHFFFAGVSFIALLLTGSRINLLITLLITLAGVLVLLLKHRNVKKYVVFNTVVMSLIVFILFVLATVFEISVPFISTNIIERMQGALSLTSISSDSSALGRFRSIFIGFDILKENPLGISGYFTNLQIETQKRGFPTFPHSTMLSYYILLGPIILVLILLMIKLLVKLFKMNLSWFFTLAYLFVFFCFTGGPIVSFKPIFFYSMLVTICYKIWKEHAESG